MILGTWRQKTKFLSSGFRLRLVNAALSKLQPTTGKKGEGSVVEWSRQWTLGRVDAVRIPLCAVILSNFGLTVVRSVSSNSDEAQTRGPECCRRVRALYKMPR